MEENELMNSMLFVIGNKGKIVCNFGPEASKGMNAVNAGIFINENNIHNLSSDGTAETERGDDKNNNEMVLNSKWIINGNKSRIAMSQNSVWIYGCIFRKRAMPNHRSTDNERARSTLLNYCETISLTFRTLGRILHGRRAWIGRSPIKHCMQAISCFGVPFTCTYLRAFATGDFTFVHISCNALMT